MDAKEQVGQLRTVVREGATVRCDWCHRPAAWALEHPATDSADAWIDCACTDHADVEVWGALVVHHSLEEPYETLDGQTFRAELDVMTDERREEVNWSPQGPTIEQEAAVNVYNRRKRAREALLTAAANL